MLERNRVQIEVKEKSEKSLIYRAVERQISRNLESWEDWIRYGYAEAFDVAWKNGMRDVDSIVIFVLTTAKTNNIIK
jgi:hypothetical protein